MDFSIETIYEIKVGRPGHYNQIPDEMAEKFSEIPGHITTMWHRSQLVIKVSGLYLTLPGVELHVRSIIDGKSLTELEDQDNA